MNTIICTLFENHYHYGVVALCNSLYQNGYKGSVYVGYRGTLPSWAKEAKPNPEIGKHNGLTLSFEEGLDIHFLPIITDWDLTNIKPDFMLQVMEDCPSSVESIFYFDPDIVVKCNWEYFQKWVKFGVALVHEIVAHDVPPNHPKRMQWLTVIEKSNRKVERKLYSYINGGFCGVHRSKIDFLETWSSITHCAIKHFGMNPNHFSAKVHPAKLFSAGDQDTLNITAMCSRSEISEFGPEGMDFIPGGWLMSHATGSPKPWKIAFFNKIISGRSITAAERNYWNYSSGLIQVHSNFRILFSKLMIKIVSFIHRFYRK